MKGGHASYGDALNYTAAGSEYESIKASYFMAYHSVCIKSVECQENIEMSRLVADNITERIRQVITENELPGVAPEDVSVWTYAIYYPYYEQYITLADDAILQVIFIRYKIIFDLTHTHARCAENCGSALTNH